ncbi:HD-GYP domain-containing protein [Lachnospiraceae bacterium C1.1]|nr:HD domain-containing phosphohydrolase [Lachnospiraceae bacterium C1.1]
MEIGEASSTYYLLIRQSDEFKEFEQKYHIYTESFKLQIDNFLINKTPIDWKVLDDIADSLVPEDMRSSLLFAYLMLISPKKEYITISHMFNSGLICRMYARWLKMDPEESCILTRSGFLYDIGKYALPDEVINKSAKLDDLEFDLIKTHAFLGKVLLSRQENINPHILNAALQHHERSDGSGYPQKLSSGEIDKFASMAAIVDVYEAMTSARSYREPLCVYQVVSRFQEDSLHKYDLNAVNPFLNNLVDDFIGSYVRLSNGMEGRVFMKNSNDLARPLIMCGDTVVDLTQDKTVSIIAII